MVGARERRVVATRKGGKASRRGIIVEQRVGKPGPIREDAITSPLILLIVAPPESTAKKVFWPLPRGAGPQTLRAPAEYAFNIPLVEDTPRPIYIRLADERSAERDGFVVASASWEIRFVNDPGGLGIRRALAIIGVVVLRKPGISNHVKADRNRNANVVPCRHNRSILASRERHPLQAVGKRVPCLGAAVSRKCLALSRCRFDH